MLLLHIILNVYEDYKFNPYYRNDQLDYQVVKQGNECVSIGNTTLENETLTFEIKKLKKCEVIANQRDIPSTHAVL